MSDKSAQSATESVRHATNERHYLLAMGQAIYEGPVEEPPRQSYYEVDGVSTGLGWVGLIRVYVRGKGAHQRTERKARLVLSRGEARALGKALLEAADECDTARAVHDAAKKAKGTVA